MYQATDWRRRLASVAGVAAVVTAALVLGVGAATAAKTAPKPPKFSGAAPGVVLCALSAKVEFSPPITDATGGTGSSNVTGKLSHCASTNKAVTVTSGKLSGSFVSSPLMCAGLSASGVASDLTVSWKGSVNGTIGSTTYGGRAAFSPSAMSFGDELVTASSDLSLTLPGASGASDVTGSFAGESAIDLASTDTSTTVTAACAHRNGLTHLALTGTIAVGGPVPGPPSIVGQVDGDTISWSWTDSDSVLPITGYDIWLDGVLQASDSPLTTFETTFGSATSATLAVDADNAAGAGPASTDTEVLPASVTVTVIDTENNYLPVNQATVAIYIGGSATPFATQITDPSGNAVFSNLPVGIAASIVVTVPDGRMQSQLVPNGFLSGSNPTITVYMN